MRVDQGQTIHPYVRGAVRILTEKISGTVPMVKMKVQGHHDRTLEASHIFCLTNTLHYNFIYHKKLLDE